MNSDTNPQHYPQWMPTAGGVLSIVAGSLGLIGSIFLLVFGNILGSTVLHDFFPSSVWQHWGWALAGGICAIIASRIMGIIALVFVAISRKEFK